jgi:hypothetical protein
MILLAHVAGVPVEELLALAPAAGAFWIALRGRVQGRSGTRRELG